MKVSARVPHRVLTFVYVSRRYPGVSILASGRLPSLYPGGYIPRIREFDFLVGKVLLGKLRLY
jgi:hypothetical protein